MISNVTFSARLDTVVTLHPFGVETQHAVWRA
jgi:hypothetical protein